MSFLNKIKDKIGGTIGSTPTLNVTMMGPRAVGKTSLMASIFSEARDTVADAGIYFRPKAETSGELIRKKLLLQNIITNRKDIQDTPKTGAIEATSVESTFSFEMGKSGRAHTVDINIKDFPGEFLTSEPEKVSQFICDSNVIMVAIDTPYLMEEDGKLADMTKLRSNPQKLTNSQSQLTKRWGGQI